MKPKIVKRNSEKKIQKLYKGNRSAKSILQNAIADSHRLNAVIIIAAMDDGSLATGWSKGMTNIELLGLVEYGKNIIYERLDSVKT